MLLAALIPIPILQVPDVFADSARVPKAVLHTPVVLAQSALYPTATLALLEVEPKFEEHNASAPIAT
jgi:hypothetical protein